MSRRRPEEHTRTSRKGFVSLINKGIKYFQDKIGGRDQTTGVRAGVSQLAVAPTEKKQEDVSGLTQPKQKIWRPFKPLKPPLAGKAQEIADRSDGTFTGFMQKLDEEGFVVFDYESTGLDDDDQPVQIGAVRIRNGKVVERLNVFVNPEKELSKWSQENLKNDKGEPITQEWLAQQMSMRDGHQLLADFVGDSVLVAHNYGNYDGVVLERVMAETGVDFTPAGTLDTLSLIKQAIPKKRGEDEDLPRDHKLGTLAVFYDVPLGDAAHTADADCEAAGEILRRAMFHADKRGSRTELLDGEKQRSRYEYAMGKYEEQRVAYEAQKEAEKKAKASSSAVS